MDLGLVGREGKGRWGQKGSCYMWACNTIYSVKKEVQASPLDTPRHHWTCPYMTVISVQEYNIRVYKSIRSLVSQRIPHIWLLMPHSCYCCGWWPPSAILHLHVNYKIFCDEIIQCLLSRLPCAFDGSSSIWAKWTQNKGTWIYQGIYYFSMHHATSEYCPSHTAAYQL